MNKIILFMASGILAISVLAACATTPAGITVRVYTATVLPNCHIPYSRLGETVMQAWLRHCGASQAIPIVNGRVTPTAPQLHTQRNQTSLELTWMGPLTHGQAVDYSLINFQGDPFQGSFVVRNGQDFALVLSTTIAPDGRSAQIMFAKVMDSTTEKP